MKLFHYFSGTIPIIVSIPHAGTYVPQSISEKFTDAASQLPDTDWHVDKLYDFVRETGAHLLVATHSRYVIDLNRARNDASLYPGSFTTGLCRVIFFGGT